MTEETIWEYHLVVRFPARDRYEASRKVATIEEGAGKADAEIELNELECLVHDEDGDEPSLKCWCGVKAIFVNEATDASPAHPACGMHIKDGYQTMLELIQEDRLDEVLDLA